MCDEHGEEAEKYVYSLNTIFSKNNGDDHTFFAVVGIGSTPPTPAIANVGKASTCHIERRKRQREVGSIITVWAMVSMLVTTKKRVLLNNSCSVPASFER